MKCSKYSFFLFLTYFISNIIFVINKGIYWDDWALFNMSPQGIMFQFEGNGLIYMGHIHIFLQELSTQPVLLYHGITFTIGILTVLFYYKTLKNIVSKQQSFMITLIMITLPLNMVSYYMICLPYTIGLFFQVLACFLILKSFSINKFILVFRVLAVFAQWVAYLFLTSTLVFSLVFLFVLIFIKTKPFHWSLTYLKFFVGKIFTRLELLLLPFVFWIVRSIYWMPSGIYKATKYNEMTIESIISSPWNVIHSFFNTFIELLQAIYNVLQYRSIVLLGIGLFLFLFLYLRKVRLTTIKIDNKIFISGIILSVGAIFPYILVNKIPILLNVNSRHEVLLSLALPLIIYYLVSLVKNQKKQLSYLSLCLTFFICVRVHTGTNFIKSYYKQLAIEMFFRESEEYRNNVVNLLISDHTLTLNEFNNEYNFYCWTGISKKATGKEDKFIIPYTLYNPELVNFINLIPKKNLIQYNMSACTNIDTISHVALIKLKTYKNPYKNLYNSVFNKQKFHHDIKELLQIKLVKYDE